MGVSQRRGRAGEDLAAAYLVLAGCRVLSRNARLAGVEVDVLVAEGDDTVLVEVKTRRRTDYGGAALALDGRQRARLARAAGALLQRGHRRVRVDLVAVEPESDGIRIVHYRNVVCDGEIAGHRPTRWNR